MAKEGKKPIGKIVLGIIVVLVIVGAVGSMGGNSTDSSVLSYILILNTPYIASYFLFCAAVVPEEFFF